jgi:hypothetical protein
MLQFTINVQEVGYVHGMIVVFRGGEEVLLIGCGSILCVGGMWM